VEASLCQTDGSKSVGRASAYEDNMIC